jgi:uncharacterized protein (DUF427 family)
MTGATRPFLIEDVITGPPPASPAIHLEPTAKRVRTVLGDVTVADSTHAMLSIETNRLPVYYFPRSDVRAGALVPSGRVYESPLKGVATYFDVVTSRRTVGDAAWEYCEALPGGEPGTDYVAFHWTLMDAWFEEDEEVFVHPRDPHHRIDILQSSRHVTASVNGVVLGDSSRPRILFETGLPPRYYLEPGDVRLRALQQSATRTGCAYKGYTTQYWAVDGRDVAWSYATPQPEVGRIAGLIAFFNERVDLTIDGELQLRPKNTPWS